jgi:hypothetical protein
MKNLRVSFYDMLVTINLSNRELQDFYTEFLQDLYCKVDDKHIMTDYEIGLEKLLWELFVHHEIHKTTLVLEEGMLFDVDGDEFLRKLTRRLQYRMNNAK